MTLSPEQTRAFGRAAESAVRALRAELYAELPRFLAISSANARRGRGE